VLEAAGARMPPGAHRKDMMAEMLRSPSDDRTLLRSHDRDVDAAVATRLVEATLLAGAPGYTLETSKGFQG